MSLSSDNFTALIHLRDQARKWKNISFAAIIIVLIVLGKVVFSSPEADNLSHNGNYIASIDIKGIILSDSHRSKILKEIADKDNIKAVILNISSPGGGIVGSEILYRDIVEITKKKPVVALLGSVAASGGYMAAIGSNHIIAHNGTLTGSIGVIMQSTEFTSMAQKLGIKFQNYKSSHLKGSPSPFEKTDTIVDEAINESVKDSYEFFSGMVLDQRKGKIAKKDIKKAIDGRVFTGRQALAIGLIDEIGSTNEAIAYLKEKHKISDLKIKEISLKKAQNGLIEKILKENSVAKLFKGSFGDKRLMAIW